MIINLKAMKTIQTLLLATVMVALLGCGTKKSASSQKGAGDTRTVKVKMLNNTTYLLETATQDETYGYTQENPIKVGGVMDSGPENERKFLNALLGPNGEKVTYNRRGSCCPFKTPNGIIEKSGLLDIYEVKIEGTGTVVKLYLNMYDKGNLYIPVGFTARKY